MILEYIIFLFESPYFYSSIIFNLFVSFLIPFVCNKADKKVLTIVRRTVEGVICSCMMLFLCVIYTCLFFHVMMTQITAIIVFLLYSLLICKDKILIKVLNLLSHFSIVSLVPLVYYAMNEIFISAEITSTFIVVFMGVLLLLVCISFMNLFSFRKLANINPLSIGIVLVIDCICIGFWIMTNFMSFDFYNIFVIGFILLSLLLLSEYFGFSLSKNIEEMGMKQAEKSMQYISENMLDLSNDNLEKIRMIRHELKNKYTYMNYLLKQREYDKLSKYFEENTDELFLSMSFLDCGNQLINSIMNIQSNNAKKYSIQIIHEIVVPDKLNYEDVDLCSLLMNLLNNAIEYYERNPNIEDKKIWTVIKQKEKMLYIEISNIILEEDHNIVLQNTTSKKDKALHGYGKKIIETICLKYNGNVSYFIRGDKITSCLVLYEKEKEKESICEV